MHKMISDHESLQTTLADVNRRINQWQWTLDQDYHTTVELSETLSAIQQTKEQLGQCLFSSYMACVPTYC